MYNIYKNLKTLQVYRLTEQYKLYLNLQMEKIYCADYHLLYEMVKMFCISQICENRITDGLQGNLCGGACRK